MLVIKPEGYQATIPDSLIEGASTLSLELEDILPSPRAAGRLFGHPEISHF